MMLEVMLLSLQVTVVALALQCIPAIALAWLLARREFPGKILLEALVHIPLVLPPVVTGFILLLLCRYGDPITRHIGFELRFTWLGAAVASAVVALPLWVRTARLAFESIDQRLEQSVASLGARPWQVWWQVSLPLAVPGIIAGAVLACARCLGEFGATIVIAGNIPGETRTLPLAIYSALQRPGGDAEAWLLAAISVFVALVAMWLAAWYQRRMVRIGETDHVAG